MRQNPAYQERANRVIAVQLFAARAGLEALMHSDQACDWPELRSELANICDQLSALLSNDDLEPHAKTLAGGSQ